MIQHIASFFIGDVERASAHTRLSSVRLFAKSRLPRHRLHGHRVRVGAVFDVAKVDGGERGRGVCFCGLPRWYVGH